MPRPEADVAAELRQFGCVPAQAEIAELSRTLFESETVINALYGAEKHDALDFLSEYLEGNMLVALSEERILRVRTGQGYGSNRRVTSHFSFWREVYSVSDESHDTGRWLRGWIAVHGKSGCDLQFPTGSVNEKKYKQFYAYKEERLLPGRMAAPSSGSTDSSASPDTTPGAFIAELERLGTLRKQELLTEEEFAAAKRKLLGV